MLFSVEIEDVTKVFKKNLKTFKALLSVNLKIPENSIFSIIGPNGAGKTTLLKIILGIINPTEGRVKVYGSPIRKDNKKMLGFLPENPAFFKNITPEEFLEFSLKIEGIKDSSRRINEVLKLVGLEDHSKEKIRNFSKGMRQRFGIAQAIINKPKILILDEPFSGLDPVAKNRLKEIILKLYRDGKTIILSSHDLYDVEELSTHIAFIKKGEVIFSSSISELKEFANYEIEFDIEKNSWQKKSFIETGVRKKLIIKDKKELFKFLNFLMSENAEIYSFKLSFKKHLESHYEDDLK